ncbi:hypothetical protein [Falseniella ignava]|uniref:FTP domain-containing protein n=1 Tax=Falseniella ignava CCUG 37419 TaxID=883112 RepID=K1MIL1_9LACT|nr:hypothetical protein [Falseniella ignava]EKB55729.1 hypothetical protein HMPREF9707_00916 [Falseniella ignava CCUG 37419]
MKTMIRYLLLMAITVQIGLLSVFAQNIELSQRDKVAQIELTLETNEIQQQLLPPGELEYHEGKVISGEEMKEFYQHLFEEIRQHDLTEDQLLEFAPEATFEEQQGTKQSLGWISIEEGQVIILKAMIQDGKVIGFERQYRSPKMLLPLGITEDEFKELYQQLELKPLLEVLGEPEFIGYMRGEDLLVYQWGSVREVESQDDELVSISAIIGHDDVVKSAEYVTGARHRGIKE